MERAQAELDVAEAEARRAREAAAAAHVTADGRIAVISPLSGKITAATAALGTFVQPETDLFRIADPQFIQIEAAVTATDAQRIAIGDKAKIVTPSGANLVATVRSVSPTLNEQTRAATVVLSLASRQESLSPGETVQVAITPRNVAPAGVVVPEDAVQNVGGRNVVFVKNAGGFKVQPVVIGSRGGGRVSVLFRIKAGGKDATPNTLFLQGQTPQGPGE